jgi:hypothetical protein
MSDDMDRLLAPTSGRIGQGTSVEQSRAAASVLVAAELAARFPRDVNACMTEIREACSRLTFAEHAEYALPQSGDVVIGPSVDLARGLALAWGHVDHGIVELLRDDKHGQSEMLAYAWEVGRNVRSSRTFIVPHAIDTSRGPKSLTRMTAITNQNNAVAARQLREVIFSVLPQWLTEEAQDMCRATVAANIDQARDSADRAVTAFDGIGVPVLALETWLGKESNPKPRGKWTTRDLAKLQAVLRSINAGMVTAEETFPGVRSRQPARVADLPAADRPVPAEPDPTDPDYRGADMTNGTENA